MKQTGSFTQGPILSPLLRFTLPVLLAYAIDTLLTSIMFCFAGHFNGCGRTTFVMVQGIVGAFLVRVPVSLIMSQMVPVSLFRVGLATPSSTVVQILLFLIYFALQTRREAKKA